MLCCSDLLLRLSIIMTGRKNKENRRKNYWRYRIQAIDYAICWLESGSEHINRKCASSLTPARHFGSFTFLTAYHAPFQELMVTKMRQSRSPRRPTHQQIPANDQSQQMA